MIVMIVAPSDEKINFMSNPPSSFSTPPRQPILPVDDPSEAWERVRLHQVFAAPPTSAVVTPPPAAAAATTSTGRRPELDGDIDDDASRAPRQTKTTASKLLRGAAESTRTGKSQEDDDVVDDDDNRILRVACVSDTHGYHRSVNVPECDVLIHAGDFTNVGEPETLSHSISFFFCSFFISFHLIAHAHLSSWGSRC